MLTGRLCWVPLLLALGVGSGGGSGGGGSRRRRLLAAKGGCWGSFLLSEEGDGAGLRAPAAGTRLTLDLRTLPCRSSPGFGAAGIPEVSALRRGPERFHLQTPAQLLGGVQGPRRSELWGVWTTLGAVLLGSGWGGAVSRGRRLGTAGAGRWRGEERQLSAPARREGSAAVPSKEGAELGSQLGDGVGTCGPQGTPPGSPQFSPGRVCLPWERAPSGWAGKSGRSAAGDAPHFAPAPVGGGARPPR